ncbi:MAG TPA: hypothetical protein VHF88_00795 [Thermoleophilaceae bacterium]|nr:hypothetical protein [Thermoleophilaceae bacterium]
MLPTALALIALLVPAQAASASVLDVQRDCADSDSFERKHSRADLKKTLNQVQADLAEYGTCREMILAALASMKGGKGASSGKFAGVDPDLNNDGVITPKERRIAAKKAKELREKRDRQIAAVDDDLIHDGDSGGVASGGGGSDGPPLPLILALVALACAGAGGGLWYASQRNPAIANALRRVQLPFRNS